MTSMWRISICLTSDLEEAITKLRMTDRYNRFSLSEIVRELLKRGLTAERAEHEQGLARQ